MTALMIASEKGHSAVVEILIAKGADINITDIVLYIYSIYSHLSHYVYYDSMEGQH